MVMLISLEEARDQIRSDTMDDDNDLGLKIRAASRAVLNYIDDQSFLNSAGEVDFDSSGNPEAPAPIKQAVCILTALFYSDRDSPDYRDGKDAPRLSNIILPRSVHFLLDPYRIPICL